jgi:pre-mRNA-splicing factor SYF1
MYTIYIAKATENFGLPATRPIYARAIEGENILPSSNCLGSLTCISIVLPDRQTAEMCLRFAALERKLGEIDRARAIYAHASQFCDPRINSRFWSEWNSFEIETGSEDTFREMLRIKRSVQAQFNTEASYLAAQTVAARQGNQISKENGEEPQDAMAAAEKQAGKGPAFVAAKATGSFKPAENNVAPSDQPRNADEIHISDDEDI